MNIANCYHIIFKKFVSNIVVKSYQLDGISEIFIFKYNEKKNYRYIYHFSLRCKWFETRTNDQLEPRSRFPSRATRFPHFSFPLAYFHSKSSVHSRVKGRVTRFSIPLQLENYRKFDGPEDMDSRRGFASLLSRELNFFLVNFGGKVEII